VSIGTAFYPRQEDLNLKRSWGEWAGYFAPAVYADFHDIEYAAIRDAVAVIDTSPLYKYVIHGKDATTLLDRVLTRDATQLRVDQVIYAPWCDQDGKVLDDGTITRLGEQEYRITAADPCYRWFVLNATNLDVEVEDVSESLAALALQGKLSREVLEGATGEGWADVKYFRHRRSAIAGVDVSVTRTGYTGDRGYEIWIPTSDALPVWDRIFEVGEAFGIHPAGIRALDVARVEAGLILIEAEYTSARHAISPEQNYSPFELGFGRLVDLKKPGFTGKAALLAERAAGGPARRLVGLELDWAGIEGMFAKHGLAAQISPFVDRSPVPVYKDGAQIGRATSITWGTTVKKMIGFGSVDKAHEKIGTRVSVEYTVEGERGKVGATVVPLPFLDLPRKRS
jgi:glycine cleavage system T protein (aminomethyltransferase)